VTAAGSPAGLTPVLKQLGLSGMLGTLEARLAEARAGTLGHAEFLQVLCEDELARRDAAKITRRIKAARFPAADATLETFDFGYNPKLPAAAIRDLARLEFIAAGEGVLAYGPVGVGKSHLAAALGHQACRRGYDVAFTTCSRLLAHLAGGHADRSFEARVRKLAKTAVPVCDDFAMREFTAAQADDLYELLTERIGRPGRSLILTSNRSPADWYPLFPNAVVGESILDRVLNTSHHLLLDGKSYRPRRRPGQHKPGPAAPRPP
jgi:DNA replication protein DnaC